MDKIYEDGRHYDQLFSNESIDLPYFDWAIRKYSGPVLELASGTGRLTIPLARAGHPISGLEIAPSMKARAEQKARDAECQINFFSGDMRAFDLDTRYNTIFVANNTINHLLKNDDLVACLGSVKRHLKRDGVFMIDSFVPDMKLLVNDDKRYPFSQYEDPDGKGTVIITHSSFYDEQTGIKHNTTYHKFPDIAEEVVGSLDMRMYFPEELDELLAENGFLLLEKFGDYDRRPFTADSRTQLPIYGLQI